MKTIFYWQINQEVNGLVTPVDNSKWGNPEDVLDAATARGGDIFVSMYSMPERMPSLRVWCCDLDLRGRPIAPTIPEREQKARKLRSDGNMHLVKYAKEHYVHSDDILIDLAHILIAWCGMNTKPEDVVLQHIFNHVYNTWVLIVPEHQRDLSYVLRDHFVWNGDRDNLKIEEFIRMMISSMRHVARTKHPSLPAGDPDILPLNPKATEAGWNEPISNC